MKKLYFKTILSLFSLFLLGFTTTSFSQANTQSISEILRKIEGETNYTSKVNLYKDLAELYLKQENDSAQFYAQKGIDLAQKIGYEKGEIRNLNILGNHFEHKSNYEEALKKYNLALEIAQKNEDIESFAILYNNIGMVYIKQGNYDDALKLMIDALRAEEVLKNDKGIAQSYNNIGVIYYYQRDFKKATEYFELSLAQQEKIGDVKAVIQAINNLGAIYDYMGENEKALNQYKKALKINREEGNKREEGINLHNIAVSYYKMRENDLSRDYYQQALEIREQIGDQNAVAHQHYNFGELLRSENKLNEAQSYYEKALNIAEKHGLTLIKQHVFGALAELFETEKDYKKANEYLYRFITVKDSMLNKENSRIIVEVETKYQTEKKEKQILQQRASIAEQNLLIEQKNHWLYLLGTLILIIALTGYQFYNTQKLKNHQLIKENELKDALIKVETQNKLQEERLRISRDLHDNIGSQLTFIISSLENLKFRLNKEKPGSGESIENITHFARNTINELRGTIWAMNKGKIYISDLKSYLENFIKNARIASPQTNFKINLSGNIDNSYTFTAFEGINIFRVIQEAVNNAVKYAEASEINIDFDKRGNTFDIRVSDNGKGIDPDNKGIGNGMANMERRILNLNGELQIDSAPGQGTTVKMIV